MLPSPLILKRVAQVMRQHYGLSVDVSTAVANRLIGELAEAHLDIVLDTWITEPQTAVVTPKPDFWTKVADQTKMLDDLGWEPWKPYEKEH